MSSALDVPNVSNNFGGCVTKGEETDKKCGVDALMMRIIVCVLFCLQALIL